MAVAKRTQAMTTSRTGGRRMRISRGVAAARMTMVERPSKIVDPQQEEMKTSYMVASMSVIVPALPDVRDGLKPSQRSWSR
jgi:hypothetical protein